MESQEKSALKKKIVIGISLTLLLTSLSTLAFDIQPAKAEPLEPPTIEWSKTYGGTGEDSAWSVAQTDDGGYIVAGATRSFGAGYYDVWLVKTNSYGDMQWNKTFGGPDYDSARCVLQTSDGGFIVAGTTHSFDVGWGDAWLIKTDYYGNIQWNKTYGGGEPYSESAASIVQTVDGGYAFTGPRFAAGYADFWLVKIDSDGNAEWDKTYGGASNDKSLSVIQAIDGGYVIVGETYSFGADFGEILLVKTDSDGNQQYTKTFRRYYLGGEISSTSVQQTSDKGYIVAATSRIGVSDPDFWLIKTDLSGNMEWNETYGGVGGDYAYSVVQTMDGGYVIAGGTTSFGAGLSDAWLVKTDSSGNMQWSKTIGGTGGEAVYSVAQTGDSGLISAGSDANADFWLIKLTPLDSDSPTTLHDYDGLWHNTDFTINLTATDDHSGVEETYYKINDGPTKTVSADGQPLITTEGADNKLEYWSVDNAGNEELPHKILTGIKLDKTYPTIETPSRTPDGEVLPDQSVRVSVNVTDFTSGVKNVTLSYTINDSEAWTELPMNPTASNLYEATIPPQEAGTTVRFRIVAYDRAGNNRTLDGTEPYCIYQVIPEFPTSLILPLFMITTLIAVILYKRKQPP